jgi:hypothetical protein
MSKSKEAKEDKFERLFRHADAMFDRAEKMFDNFPWSEPLGNGFFQRTVQYKNTVPFFEECEDESDNDPSEYKVVKTPAAFKNKEAIEEWLNGYGADGWDLNCFEFGYAIFSRYIEDEDETEESGPEDV